MHPAYWSRGHGKRLARWGVELAKIDKIKTGVIASKMGENLYEDLGYYDVQNVHIDGDVQHPGGVSCVVMILDLTEEI